MDIPSSNKVKSINDLDYSVIENFNKYIRPNIFIPQSVADIENLEVMLEEVKEITHKGKHLYELYYSAVVMLSSWGVTEKRLPGRFMPWFVREKKQGRYLGIIVLGSDLHNNSVRDKEIGWTAEHKFKNNRLQNVVIGKTVIPFRTFGSECLGGKLLTKMIQTKIVIDRYEEKYKDKTVLLTVISLNPRPCQYNGIPHWTCVGDSVGDAEGNNKRPTFMCPLFENYKDFLCCKIEEPQLVPNGSLIDIQTAVDWWKPKAVKRMTQRIKEGTFTTNEQYYDVLRTKSELAHQFIDF
jgi:hypothetical protein